MKKGIIVIFTIFWLSKAVCQIQGTKIAMDTLDHFPISYSQIGNEYTIEGKTVSKVKFDSLVKYNDRIADCCPCLIRFKSKVDSSLIYEQVKCDRKWVGEYKKYDSLGNVSLSGYFMNQPLAQKPDTLSIGMGDHGNKTGPWVNYNSIGDTISIEYWKNGFFILAQDQAKFIPVNMAEEGRPIPYVLNKKQQIIIDGRQGLIDGEKLKLISPTITANNQ